MSNPIRMKLWFFFVALVVCTSLSMSNSSPFLRENQKDSHFEQVFACSFDDTNPSCAFKPKYNGSVPTYSVSATASQLIGSYKITDVTSIIAPTANGQHCEIPFSDAGVEYYHCRNLGSDCKTPDGTFSKCATGKFHYAKPGLKFEAYAVEFLLPTINLPGPGYYQAQFYILMWCNKEGCEEAQDFISITAKDTKNDNSLIVNEEFHLESIPKEKMWTPVKMTFYAPNNELTIAFHLGRRVNFGTSNFLAFDQFELLREVSDSTGETQAITTTTTTTTTAAEIHISEASTSTETDEISTSTEPSTVTTTTTTTTTTEAKTSSEEMPFSEVKVYSCTFDGATCGVTSKTNGSEPTYSKVLQTIQSVGSYRITDVTSITKEAANGEHCQIPYTDADVEYYHCRSTSPECKTTNGEFSRCANGRFHYAKAGPTLNPFTVEYTFATINLPDPGSYLARFYIMMLCNKDDCGQAQDFISIMVRDGENSNPTLAYREFLLGDIEMEKKWIQYEIKFDSPSNKINLAFYLGRRFKFDTANFMAFDHVELFEFRNDGETVIVQTFPEQTTEIEVPEMSSTHDSHSTHIASESDPATTDVVTETTTTTTTTTTTITSTMEATSADQTTTTTKNSVGLEEVKIFACSFDDTNPSCAMKFKTNMTVPTYSIVLFSSQTVGTYRITDVTSITTPTANGEVCQIPYSEGTNEYFHCRNAATNECKTMNGAFAKCADGKFHYAKPSAKFEPYTVEFLLPVITLPEPGDYVAKFYLLMLCNKEGCDQAQDFISVTVNDANNGNNTLVYKEYLLNDLEREKKWIPFEVKFKASTEKVYLVFHLGRRVLFGTSNFLAFDQVELYQLRDGQHVTVDTTHHEHTDEATDITTTTTTPTTTTTTETQTTTTTEDTSAEPQKTTEDFTTTTESTSTTTTTTTHEMSTSDEASTKTDATTTTTTTTTSTTTTTTTTTTESTTKNGGAAVEIKVLDCNFDATVQSCGFKYKFNGTTPSYSSFPANIQIVGTYKITDVTSITAPAANGELCQIPFVEAGTEYFHCRNAQTDCRTTSGVFSKCADGKFHYAKPSATKLEPYTIEYLLPVITLPEPGDFAVRFYVLMFCNKEGCDQAQDFISVTVNDAINQNSTLAYNEYTLNNIEREKKWIPQEIRFKATTDKIYLVLHFGRRVVFATSNLLAFDQLELVQIKGGGIPVTDDDKSTEAITTTTTSSTTTTTPMPDTTTTTTTTTTSSSDPSASPVTDTDVSSSTRDRETTTTTTASTTTTTATTTASSNLPTGSVDQSTDEIPSMGSVSSDSPITTTTTTLGDVTTTTRPGPSELSYSCDFDGPLTSPSICGGVYLEKGTGTGKIGFDREVILDQTPFFITDYSSITKPTKSNKKCRIPFKLNGLEYDYCALNKAVPRCETIEDGSLDDCTTGNFLYAKSRPTGEPFNVYMQAPLSSINPGIYEADFVVSMYCDHQNCNQAKDFLSFGVAYIDKNREFIENDSIYQIIELDNIGGQKKWIKKSVTFEITDKANSRPVLIIRMGRRSLFNQTGYIAFDELNVYKSDQATAPTPITVPFAETTTSSPLDLKKKSNLTSILVGVLVPLAFVAMIVLGGLYVWRYKPHLLNRVRKRYMMPHFDNSYKSLSSENQKSYDSGIELKMSQIEDD